MLSKLWSACVWFYVACCVGSAISVEINCIPVKLCPLALKLLVTKKYTPETISFMKTSHCGYDDNYEPMVWCSKILHCKTPLNENGTCKNIKSCPYLIDLIKTCDTSKVTVKEYLQGYRCNTHYDKEVEVCCPDASNGKNVISDRYGNSWNRGDHHTFQFHNQRRTKHHEHKFLSRTPYSYVRKHNPDMNRDNEANVFEYHRFRKRFFNDPKNVTLDNQIPSSRENKENNTYNLQCETPDKKKGVCKPARDCKSFRELLSSGTLDLTNQTTKQFILDLECANTTNKIYICCSEDEKSIQRGFVNISYKNPENCGRATIGNKIFGGQETDLGEYPWLALFQYQTNNDIRYGCGGTLINNRHVITAAHCLDRKILRQKGLGQLFRIILGEYDIRNETDCIYTKYGADCADPPQYYGIESMSVHPLYSSITAKHDIAIVRLDREVHFSDYIRPICLPTERSNPAFSPKGNESLYIAGWGKTETEKMSPVKLKARLTYTRKSECTFDHFPLSDGQICAGKGNGTDSCYGDSGGPLMMEVNQPGFGYATNLLGIISYGILNCGTGPSVFAYVPYYMDWISENVK